MATVVLVRHGRTTANSSGVLAGWLPDVHLDEVGIEQATELGRRCATMGFTPARVVSSPLPRCQDTAARLLQEWAPDRDVVSDDRLGECRYGAWTGRPLAELAEDPLWRVVQDQPSAARFPDGEEYAGESLAAMSARAVAAIRETDAAIEAGFGGSALWVAVTHGDVVKAVVADALGQHLDLFQRIVVDPGSATVIRYTAARPMVLTVNSVGGRLPIGAEAHGRPGDAAVGGGAGSAPAGSAG